MKQVVNVQDTFLNQVRKENIPVTVYLTNGYQLKGFVRSFDNFTVVIESDGKQQMIYKHAISTFHPARAVNLYHPQEPKSSEESPSS